VADGVDREEILRAGVDAVAAGRAPLLRDDGEIVGVEMERIEIAGVLPPPATTAAAPQEA
jgi:hypothetical protein